MPPDTYPIADMPREMRGAASHAVDPLLTDRESAAVLRVGLSTFRRFVAQGLISQPVKLGHAARWPRSEILAVIEAAKAQRDAAVLSPSGVSVPSAREDV